MDSLELYLFLLAVVGSFAGGFSVYLTHNRDIPFRVRWGQRIFLINMLMLGSSIVAAAWLRSHSLPLLGLCAGLLLVAVVWEAPISITTMQDTAEQAAPREIPETR